MNIVIKKRTSWLDVLNAARFTQHLKPLYKEPSDGFKRQILLSEHSPIRDLEFELTLTDVPSFVVMHLVRYNLGCNKYVASSRPDITGAAVTRHEQRKDDPCDVRFVLNAAAIMHISHERLCATAEKDTREVWKSVIEELRKIDPILAEKCVPQCLYRGFCPERNPCGRVNRANFHTDLLKYRNKE